MIQADNNSSFALAKIMICSYLSLIHFQNRVLVANSNVTTTLNVFLTSGHVDNLDDCDDKSDESSLICCGDANQFHCGRRVCISQSVVCNGVNDCANGEDELDCQQRKSTLLDRKTCFVVVNVGILFVCLIFVLFSLSFNFVLFVFCLFPDVLICFLHVSKITTKASYLHFSKLHNGFEFNGSQLAKMKVYVPHMSLL